MKTKLIMLDTPIIVSDEKIKKGDFCWNTYNNIYEVITEHQVKTANDYIKSGDVFKIIAGFEGLPSINWNGLEEEFGYIDVENLALEVMENTPDLVDTDIDPGSYFDGIYEGALNAFKKAQFLNEKKFSLDSVEQAIRLARSHRFDTAHGVEWDYSEDEIIRALQQPKVFDIKVEMLSDSPYDPRSKTGRFEVGDTDKVVIRNNSIKILKKL